MNVTAQRADRIHRTARELMQAEAIGAAEAGWRAALARDPKLLSVLEQMAETTHGLEESQRGESRRAARNMREQTQTQEHQGWREAFKAADNGAPLRVFLWLYGAAAVECGITPRPYGR